MTIKSYYNTRSDMLPKSTVYDVVSWVYEDPDRAIDFGVKLVILGSFVLVLAGIAKAWKE